MIDFECVYDKMIIPFTFYSCICALQLFHLFDCRYCCYSFFFNEWANIARSCSPLHQSPMDALRRQITMHPNHDLLDQAEQMFCLFVCLFISTKMQFILSLIDVFIASVCAFARARVCVILAFCECNINKCIAPRIVRPLNGMESN